MRISDWSSDVCSSDLRVHSMVLWGPPGCGKTTLALLLAKYADAEFKAISAVLSGLPEVRQVLADAAHRFAEGRRTVLFVDEVHRLKKRSEERRVGKECVSTCRSRGSPDQ